MLPKASGLTFLTRIRGRPCWRCTGNAVLHVERQVIGGAGHKRARSLLIPLANDGSRLGFMVPRLVGQADYG